MAVITPTNMRANDAVTVNVTTLGASDTFVYNPDKRPVLIIRNGTGGAVTPLIDGDGAAVFAVPEYGSVDPTTGKSLGSVAAGATRAIDLKVCAKFLVGTITLTGASGASAQLLEF